MKGLLIKRELLSGLFFLAGLISTLSVKAAVNALSPVLPDNYSRYVSDTSKRKALLKGILELLPSDITKNGRISYLDETFKDWLKRTGELPPDFDKMPSIPYLPNSLIIDEGGKNIPVKTKKQWEEKKEWMRKELQHYITGTFPPVPDNLVYKVIGERKDGKTTIRTVELSFGPDHKAIMTLELMIPPGEGPFPVFMTQWNHLDWAKIAVRRGYIGCIYAGCDMRDDTKNYSEIWAGKYDFSRIMRRAYGASRVVDYLYTLPDVNKKQIGITGHSRNGKQSLWAAAYDTRFTAVITSSGGSGGEIPWRYTSHKYGCEDIALLSTAQPSWLNPRLRFFIGRENKLPVDQNSFMALVAPRGLMLSSSRRESDGNPWGIEQAFDSTLKIYEFLGKPDHLVVRLRDGRHGTSARDIESYVDFFDYVFGRSERKPENKLFYKYAFKSWQKESGEKINPLDYPQKTTADLMKDDSGKEITKPEQWERKKAAIQKTLRWALGEEPAGITNKGPLDFAHSENLGENYYGNMIPRPEATSEMGRVTVAPGHSKPGFGDYLYGYLYYPKELEKKMKEGKVKLPVIIYLHKYNYSNGFYDTQGFDHNKSSFIKALVKQGYAVFFYDMMGFGNRIEEGTDFYQRYPHWSKMGKLVTDVKGAVTALGNLNFIDDTKITVMGYSLGATVGLYAAALDKRIAGVVSVCGFTPMRKDTPDKGTEGIKGYSHLRGLLPRLGFFVGNESRIPYDFDGILGSIAPRPLLVIAPQLDQDATLKDVQDCVTEVEKVYQLYDKPKNIDIYSPFDYSRFSRVMQQKVLDWYEDLKQDTNNGTAQWETLFDGNNTDKWVTVGRNSFPDSTWEVKDGTLSVKEHKGRESIMTKETYNDFELAFDFKLTYAANSGIKYIVNKIKNNKTGKTEWNGPEYQIIDDYNNEYVKDHKHDVGSTASLYLMYAPENKTLYPVGQWNHGKIVVNKNHIEHWLNGVKVVSCERGSTDFRQRVSKTKFNIYTHYGELPVGHIMLTNHGDKVYFRNIMIKRLN